MSEPSPRLSVIITAYNQERYLAQSIASVVEQDFDDLEIIVVDDGSTDRTADVAGQFAGIRLIRQENRGHGAALNTGVAAARGELLAFLDGDDLWMPGTLAARVSTFDLDSEVEMIHGMGVQFLSPELDRDPAAKKVDSTPSPAPVCGTTMIRREAFDRVGPLETNHRLGSFMDWLLRARDAELVVRNIGTVVLKRRIHDDNIGSRERDSRSDYAKLLKIALDRRRAIK